MCDAPKIVCVKQRSCITPNISPHYNCLMATSTTSQTQGTSALVAHLARLTRAKAETALAPLGLRPRHLVALTVLRNQGPASQQVLANTLRIDRTNLVGLLNELETDGLIVRERSVEDRRRHNVALTEAGVERLDSAEAALESVEDDVLGSLDAEQRATLHELLQTVTRGHAAECEEHGPDIAACTED